MYLWSNPDLPHWQRLLLGVVYLPMLFWWWLVGNQIRLDRRPTTLESTADHASASNSTDIENVAGRGG